MPDIAASDVTVTVQKQQLLRGSPGAQRRNRVKIDFGDDALTYGTGVPMPVAAKFGMQKDMEYLILFDQDDSRGHVWKYDFANKKLRCYVQGAVVGAAGVQTLDDFPVTAGDGVTADTHLSLKAGNATIRWGVMVEMAATDAPAAQTMFAEAVGY